MTSRGSGTNKGSVVLRVIKMAAVAGFNGCLGIQAERQPVLVPSLLRSKSLACPSSHETNENNLFSLTTTLLIQDCLIQRNKQPEKIFNLSNLRFHKTSDTVKPACKNQPKSGKIRSYILGYFLAV